MIRNLFLVFLFFGNTLAAQKYSIEISDNGPVLHRGQTYIAKITVAPKSGNGKLSVWVYPGDGVPIEVINDTGYFRVICDGTGEFTYPVRVNYFVGNKLVFKGNAVRSYKFIVPIAAGAKEFQNFFGGQAKHIARKIYDAGLNGTIAAYSSDSMTGILSLSEVEKQGAVLRVTKTYNDVDTAYYELFNSENMVPDVSIIYGITKQKAGIGLVPKGLGLCFKERYPNNIVYPIPLFFSAYEETVKKVLTAEEADFMENYSIYKLFEQFTVTPEDKELNLTNAWYSYSDLSIFRSGTFTSEISLGQYLYVGLKEQLFADSVRIVNSNGVQISKDSFNKRHGIEASLQLEERDDPTIIKDTSYIEIPWKYDSLSFEFVNGKKTVVVHQRIGRSGEYEQYYIRFEDLKGKLSEDIYSWVDVFYRTYFRP